jgi:predicted TIM-barrel fold metal-dependent hydrolase
MEIVDAQLHDFGPQRHWGDVSASVRHGVMTELMLAWMDATGVSKALIFPTDDQWTHAAITEFPNRFAGVYKIADPERSDVVEQVAESKTWPGSLGLRLSFGRLPWDPEGAIGSAKFTSGAFHPFFEACESQRVPLFCSAYGFMNNIAKAAEDFPGLQLIVDHMGIAQPPLNPRENPPWRSLSNLLPLARYPNIAVKMTGAPVLSDEPYPYLDLWPHLRGMLDAFGAERVMWASDIGRFQGRIGWENLYPEAHSDYHGKHSYAESLFCVLHSTFVSESERALLLGGTVKRLLKWG